MPAFLDHTIAIVGRQLPQLAERGLRSVGLAGLHQPYCPQPQNARPLLVAVGSREILAMSQGVFSRPQTLERLLIVSPVLSHAPQSLRLLQLVRLRMRFD